MEFSPPAVQPGHTPQESGSGEPRDRRKEPRYVPVMESAYLGWWEGETLRAELGVLWNISAGGAAMDVAVEVETGDTVWLCIVDLTPVRWVAARVVGREERMVRMQFAEPFACERLERVVWGLPEEEAGVASAASLWATPTP
ncbi:MAG: PilZ domain-containing protein [Isosphaeraceae bacterium]|nr:PilZ domain-containing protein [Isosphaeraceae bacterium]